jgi:hypothetical protein
MTRKDKRKIVRGLNTNADLVAEQLLAQLAALLSL